MYMRLTESNQRSLIEILRSLLEIGELGLDTSTLSNVVLDLVHEDRYLLRGVKKMFDSVYPENLDYFDDLYNEFFSEFD